MVSRIDAHGIAAACSMIFLGGATVSRALDHYRRKLKIEDTGTIPVKSAPQGFVELQGYAWPRDSAPLTSILNDHKVVFYMLQVEEYVRRGKSSQWVKIFEEQSTQNFLIADPSGVALLNVQTSDCDLTRTTRPMKALTSAEQMRLRTYLASKNIQISQNIFNNYRVTEGVIYPGSPLCLTGFFQNLNSNEKVAVAPGLSNFLVQLKIAKKAPVWAMQHPIAVGDSITIASQSTESDFTCYGMVSSNISSDEKLFFADCHRLDLLNRLSKHLELKIFGGTLLIAGGATLLLLLFQRT